MKKIWNYVVYLRNNRDIANKLFDHISAMRIKNNANIMKIIDNICKGQTFEKAIENKKK